MEWMMMLVFVIFFMIIVVISVVKYISDERARREGAILAERARLYTMENLGIQQHSIKFYDEMYAIVTRLENSLDEEYIAKVRKRVQAEQKWTDSEWENFWFETKRFFVMTAVLRSVEMYSADVDKIWHEMLMFTREYEKFTHAFLGTYLHHEPHAKGEASTPEQRLCFDLVYCYLYFPTKFSNKTWGKFFAIPMPEEWLAGFAHNNTGVVPIAWRSSEGVVDTRVLAEEMGRYQIKVYEDMKVRVEQSGINPKQYHSTLPVTEGVIGTLSMCLFLSLHHANQYNSIYNTVYALGGYSPRSDSGLNSTSGCGSSCSGVDCGDSGSSCGSSCGGGGCGSS
ncbi:hypothetical protein [Mechercharimyces sp. CAU 1602]|uniref:hypothetical protein n=1 Tax=Mechercharimyces sp. CAU 1602 TaxID=2973933 RepID=UPI0021630100|nr:hypothetical protein [Mechercharimyces sp. CAU 1602]MCS1351920.1 hypothetical protein [Mechercharimyces sp. CAU 1602]